MERIPIRPQAVWYISGLANRRVHFGKGIVLTSKSGIIDFDVHWKTRPRSARPHSHRVLVGFGPPLPKEDPSRFDLGATTLLDWHRSLRDNFYREPFEYCRGHLHHQSTKTYLFTHGLRIQATSWGKMHDWTLKVEQKTESKLEALSLLEWDQMRCEDEKQRCLRTGEH